MPTYRTSAHEAGHAVILLSNGDVPKYIVVGGRQDDSVNGLNDVGRQMFGVGVTNYIAALLGGYAAEYKVYKEEQCPKIAAAFQKSEEANFLNRSRNRCASDIHEFVRCCENIGGLNDNKLFELFRIEAIRRALPIIDKNIDLFNRVRKHLEIYGFAGPQCLQALNDDIPVAQENISADFESVPLEFRDQLTYQIQTPPAQQTRQVSSAGGQRRRLAWLYSIFKRRS